MNESKKRGPSAYNTAYDELPEYFALFSPNMWLALLEIMLMIVLSIVLLTVVEESYMHLSPEVTFLGMIACVVSLSIPNFAIAYGYEKGILYLKCLCIISIFIALPGLFINSMVSSSIAIFLGIMIYWITNTNKFRLFMLHRIKMGEWRREQLEKNKIRREIIKEQKQKEKLARTK